MELELVAVTNKNTGVVQYYAVNDQHYDGMLASGGCHELEKDYDWKPLGIVRITEEILNEQGYFWKDDRA